MLEVKPAPSVLMGHPNVASPSPTVADNLMVTSGSLDQAEVLNRLNGNYGPFNNVRSVRDMPGTGSMYHNNHRNNSHHHNACGDDSVSAMRTWPSSPSSASSTSSSFSSLSSSSSSSTASSSSILSSEIEIDKENKIKRNLGGSSASSNKVPSPCALEAAVRDFGYSLRRSRGIVTDRYLSLGNNDVSPTSNSSQRHSNPCSDLQHAFRSPCREDNRTNSFSRHGECKPSRRSGSEIATWRSLRADNAVLCNTSNRKSPTRTKSFARPEDSECGSPCNYNSGLISPTSKAIADSLSERRACHDFAKYLISPSSASVSPSSRSPGTPSNQICGSSPASPAASSLYRGMSFSQSANVLSTRNAETPSPSHASCSSSPTVAARLRSLGSNSYHSQNNFRRQQQRDRKFRLNLFMYSALYRKQRRGDSGYIIYHNPIEAAIDADSYILAAHQGVEFPPDGDG
ncbi:hypothetical protein RRG08_064970 [Elysia crispata]|uniref:Uncharacterized protein n=1 Tax=Elysia crispata TaxID=231223 RepID=A0AAE0YBD1_9GAST|nr:hypothetical protein RRG08_064970 [Elysia crispata]